MRKLPIILTLLLAGVWIYTCWYWYTCNIKGFCDDTANYNTQQLESISKETTVANTDQSSNLEVTTDTLVQDREGSPKLSAEDVLFDPLPKEVEQDEGVQEESTNSGSVTEEGNNVLVQTGSTLSTITSDPLIGIGFSTICEQPIIGPISLSGDNNEIEVSKLERFLKKRGESINIDGEYSDADAEAVKRFQLEYKEDVLDPWGITTPTGYVGKTSIAKINEIACK